MASVRSAELAGVPGRPFPGEVWMKRSALPYGSLGEPFPYGIGSTALLSMVLGV